MGKNTIGLAKNYVSPIDEPLKYPGSRPDGSFILDGEYIHPILYDTPEKGGSGSTYAGRALIDNEGNTQRIDDYLKSKKKAPLGERYAVLGFGSNPVPGQLIRKFGEDAVVPVIFGEMEDTDVVYNLIASYGCAYAELALNQSGVNGNVAITFLDSEQLRLMNETEGGDYDLAFVPKDVILESGEKIRGGERDVPGLFYAGSGKIWVPKGYDKPVAIAELPSAGRVAKALYQEEILDLVVSQFGELRRKGIRSGAELCEYIRTETTKDSSNKVKDYLQKSVDEDPRSLEPVKSQVTTLENPLSPPKVFGDI
ncbi:MAG: hypothetical protein KAS32_29555 [Candidatus Peribacteraceae bacterium]|nr:hypothetical protein [Candidatus Peribacteraceae bacterium]